jgi:hypothetical protein
LPYKMLCSTFFLLYTYLILSMLWESRKVDPSSCLNLTLITHNLFKGGSIEYLHLQLLKFNLLICVANVPNLWFARLCLSNPSSIVSHTLFEVCVKTTR